MGYVEVFKINTFSGSKMYMCIIYVLYFLNIHKHVHSVSDQQLKKIQTITILTDNKTKFMNIEKL